MKFYLRVVVAVFIFGLSTQIFAANKATVSGTITDSLGAVIADARVELVENDTAKVAQTTKTDGSGRYTFAVPDEGRFHIRAEASSFQAAISQQRFAGRTHSAEINLTLSPLIVSQEIVVTATGVPTPELQTGASISVVDEQSLATRRDLEQELRLQPGAQMSRAGQPGAQASLNLRGGPSGANKVLIDGIPSNDIGGAFNFANLSAAGYQKVEVLRGPNSALYGSDALASVISIETRRGVTPLPEVSYSIDGGNLGTYRQEGTLGGAWRRFDYFTDASRFDTQNSTPNSQYHNGSYLANVGWQILPGTELRATARRSVSAFNAANAFDLYKIADDGVTREQDTAFGVTLENRPNERWHNLLRYSGLRLRSENINFGPTGILYDPFNSGFPVFLGQTVTLRGANGYQVTGQGILQFDAGSPSSAALSDRDSVYAQTDFRLNSKLAGLFGFRYEREGGYTTSVSSFGSSKSPTERGNFSYMVQLNGGLWNRLYYTVGSGLEKNSVFGLAATPRASLAYYVAKPHDNGVLNGTRLAFNFAKGIQEPSIFYQTDSLYGQLQSPSVPNGQQLIAQYGIQPFRAETSRTYDGGVQQTLLQGKARISFTYFHNEFGDQAEFVQSAPLLQLGVPAAVVSTLPFFGAAVNSLSYRAQGTELEAEYHITRNLTVRGGWTHVDAVVQHSFANDTSQLAFNPLFPTIPIGAFSPLVGARPFRIAPNTGFFSAAWNGGRWNARLTGSLVSRRDDSDFLSDKDFGNSMLLPNRNLDAGYQKLDLSGGYRLTKRVSAFAIMENLLDQNYHEDFGYPALPFTIRAGMQFRFGGESWKLR